MSFTARVAVRLTLFPRENGSRAFGQNSGVTVLWHGTYFPGRFLEFDLQHGEWEGSGQIYVIAFETEFSFEPGDRIGLFDGPHERGAAEVVDVIEPENGL